MYEWHYAGCYWGERKETPLEGAVRAELFFRMLMRCDPTFTQWFQGGRGAPRSLPGHPVQPPPQEQTGRQQHRRGHQPELASPVGPQSQQNGG